MADTLLGLFCPPWVGGYAANGRRRPRGGFGVHHGYQTRRARTSHHRCGCVRAESSAMGKQHHPPEPRTDFSHLEGRLSSPRKMPRVPRRKGGGTPLLITVNRSDSKWSDSWQTQQATTLKDLGLEAMAVESSFEGPGKPPADGVIVDLAVQKTGWGFFVQAQVHATTQQQCNRCFVKLSTPINGSFQAWLTPTRDSFVHPQGTGEDNDDPTVVYFPPGDEVADLTGMVRDTIRLTHSAKVICSEACEKLGPGKWEVGGSDMRAVDSRWLPLLKAKRNLKS